MKLIIIWLLIMDVLLDTCTLLLAMHSQNRLPDNIRNIINDTKNDIFVSNTSLWEIEIKHIKNSESMPYDSSFILNALIDSDIKIINLRNEYIMGLKDIVDQHIHNDPFDHIILSMAKDEKMKLITHDEMMKKYKGIDILGF